MKRLHIGIMRKKVWRHIDCCLVNVTSVIIQIFEANIGGRFILNF